MIAWYVTKFLLTIWSFNLGTGGSQLEPSAVVSSANRMFCADAECKEPISLGFTSAKSDPGYYFVYNLDEPVRVMSKYDNDMWGVEINGHQEFIPKNHVSETRLLVQDPRHEIVVRKREETGKKNSSKSVAVAETEVKNTVQEVVNEGAIEYQDEVTNSKEVTLENKVPRTTDFVHKNSSQAVTPPQMKIKETSEPVQPEASPSLQEKNLPPLVTQHEQQVYDGTTIPDMADNFASRDLSVVEPSYSTNIHQSLESVIQNPSDTVSTIFSPTPTLNQEVNSVDKQPISSELPREQSVLATDTIETSLPFKSQPLPSTSQVLEQLKTSEKPSHSSSMSHFKAEPVGISSQSVYQAPPEESIEVTQVNSAVSETTEPLSSDLEFISTASEMSLDDTHAVKPHSTFNDIDVASNKNLSDVDSGDADLINDESVQEEAALSTDESNEFVSGEESDHADELENVDNNAADMAAQKQIIKEELLDVGVESEGDLTRQEHPKHESSDDVRSVIQDVTQIGKTEVKEEVIDSHELLEDDQQSNTNDESVSEEVSLPTGAERLVRSEDDGLEDENDEEEDTDISENNAAVVETQKQIVEELLHAGGVGSEGDSTRQDRLKTESNNESAYVSSETEDGALTDSQVQENAEGVDGDESVGEIGHDYHHSVSDDNLVINNSSAGIADDYSSSTDNMTSDHAEFQSNDHEMEQNQIDIVDIDIKSDEAPTNAEENVTHNEDHVHYADEEPLQDESGQAEEESDKPTDFDDSESFDVPFEGGVLLHYVEALNKFVPEWLHNSFHWDTVDGVSPRFAVFLSTVAVTLVFILVIYLVISKWANEKPLLLKLAESDKQLFKAKQEVLIVRSELEEAKRNGEISTPILSTVDQCSSEVGPSLEEVKQLKTEKEELTKIRNNLDQQLAGYEERFQQLNYQLEQSKSELREAESIVQECLEEKKKRQEGDCKSVELVKAIDTLRDQLNGQRDVVQKYEHKIKKRDNELKEKVQESRKLKADLANATLKIGKLSAQLEDLKKELAAQNEAETVLLKQMSELRHSLETAAEKEDALNIARKELHETELELKKVSNQLDVAKESLSLAANFKKEATKTDEGWDDFDAVACDDDETDFFSKLEDISTLRVDLRNALSDCDALRRTLSEAKAEIESGVTCIEQLKVDLKGARDAGEQALKDRRDLEQKLEVLSTYFNQREAELQKQLGLQSALLGDAEQGSEFSAKKMQHLCGELDSYKAQCKTLKLEMEEQERSLKMQCATLEKKQHESWVTVRQETRRVAEVQAESQALRNRLTVTEAKLLEKDVEIENISMEKQALQESLEHVTEQYKSRDNTCASCKVNSSHSKVHSDGANESFAVEGSDLPPPDLPPLPVLQPMMGMPYQSMMYPADMRPAPLGRRSPIPQQRNDNSVPISPSSSSSSVVDFYPPTNGNGNGNIRTNPLPNMHHHRSMRNHLSRQSIERDQGFGTGPSRNSKTRHCGPKTSSPMVEDHIM